MKGRIVDFLVVTPLRSRLTIDLEGDFREVIEKLRDFLVDIKIVKFKGKRSLDANAYFWTLIDKLSTTTGIPVKDLYFDALRNVGGNMEVYCGRPKAIDALCDEWAQKGTFGWPYDRFPSKIDGCENVRLYYGSSTFDSTTFSRMLDHTIQDCKTCGIEVLPDEELKSLFEVENAK